MGRRGLIVTLVALEWTNAAVAQEATDEPERIADLAGADLQAWYGLAPADSDALAEFIETYPDSPLVREARHRLDQLGHPDGVAAEVGREPSHSVAAPVDGTGQWLNASSPIGWGGALAGVQAQSDPVAIQGAATVGGVLGVGWLEIRGRILVSARPGLELGVAATPAGAGPMVEASLNTRGRLAGWAGYRLPLGPHAVDFAAGPHWASNALGISARTEFVWRPGS